MDYGKLSREQLEAMASGLLDLLQTSAALMVVLRDGGTENIEETVPYKRLANILDIFCSSWLAQHVIAEAKKKE